MHSNIFPCTSIKLNFPRKTAPTYANLKQFNLNYLQIYSRISSLPFLSPNFLSTPHRPSKKINFIHKSQFKILFCLSASVFPRIPAPKANNVRFGRWMEVKTKKRKTLPSSAVSHCLLLLFSLGKTRAKEKHKQINSFVVKSETGANKRVFHCFSNEMCNL